MIYMFCMYLPLIVQEPSFRPALRRLPEGWRVNMTLLRVQGYYSNLAA